MNAVAGKWFLRQRLERPQPDWKLSSLRHAALAICFGERCRRPGKPLLAGDSGQAENALSSPEDYGVAHL
jgi:hypothetical protein